MRKRLKFLGVTFMALLMILLAFSGAAHIAASYSNGKAMDNLSEIMPFNSSKQNVAINGKMAFLNEQEIHDLRKFMIYNLIHYGTHHSILDQLQYKADLNFATWYIGNFSQIPSSYRGITLQNSSIILPLWENENPLAISDVQAVANYEVSRYTKQNEIDTAYVVNNRLGNLVSNRTVIYANQSANLLVYSYTQDNSSLVYEVIYENGSIRPIDPYIRLNAFTIHWGWGGLISGTSYNIYFTFTNHNTALKFKNFLSSALSVQSSVDYAATIIGWTALGSAIGSAVPVGGTLAGALVGLIGGIASAILDTTDPTTVATTINNLFINQEDYSGQFELVYTLNTWAWGLVPEFSWWGYINPGQILTQVYKSVQLGSGGVSDFKSIYYDLTNKYGTNVEKAFSSPSSWYTIAKNLENFT